MNLLHAGILAVALAGVTACCTKKEQSMPENHAIATFAGGCFWCMQPPYDKLPGVVSTTVGYTGGTVENPTYQEVCEGETGHLEVVRIVFDPAGTSYRELLEVFWYNIDPTDLDGQFVDRGSQYRTAVFYHDADQRRTALESKSALEASGRFEHPIATEVLPAAEFYPAEEYHQMYYRKKPQQYGAYKAGSGRSAFIDRAWKEK